ncbi:uncharacterized protein BO87DRAFT_392716 [Aspergillus neoniger CBS 115656]|uniref:Uncharacterized protein n=1 Tax=Aspergillus neoniger (strain CBS 115656) TaxID=1448310 RepID=A0A318YXX2_ASPNB|nr:hypothetical protein BO87DRAFT_392716 [Aspergillus neoniger CBS 115656]PYH39044.1 hypothetical protein BO87DRAFT_392716 [Aspergillus neoniger CBS 115656]
MAMTCLAECPTKMAKQGCEDASLTDRPGREGEGTAGKEAAAATEDEDVVVGGGQRWLLFGEIWRTRSSFPPTSSPGCGYDKTLQEEMEKQLEAYRKQRSIRQRTAKRVGTKRKMVEREERGGGKTGGERRRVLSSTDDLVRTDGHESSIARPVEILQLDEFMSQSRRGLEPWICLNDGNSRPRSVWSGAMVVWIKGPSWTVHITEEARPRKRVVSGEAPGTAASADQKSSADGPRAATLGDVNHSMLPRPFVW